MTDSRTGTKKIQNESVASLVLENTELLQKKKEEGDRDDGGVVKGHKGQTERPTNGQGEQLELQNK